MLKGSEYGWMERDRAKNKYFRPPDRDSGL